MIRVLSISFAMLGTVMVTFLGFWYWEVVLWVILAPLALTSLYLAWRLWWPTRSTSRAVIYWAVSLVWVLTLVMVSFKDVTVFGGITATVLTSGLIVLIYGCVQKSLTST
jgi:hypothetical protein